MARSDGDDSRGDRLAQRILAKDLPSFRLVFAEHKSLRQGHHLLETDMQFSIGTLVYVGWVHERHLGLDYYPFHDYSVARLPLGFGRNVHHWHISDIPLPLHW